MLIAKACVLWSYCLYHTHTHVHTRTHTHTHRHTQCWCMDAWRRRAKCNTVDDWKKPLTEEIRLKIFGSRDLTIWWLDLSSDGDSVYTGENLCKNLGTPVKTCLICTETPVPSVVGYRYERERQGKTLCSKNWQQNENSRNKTQRKKHHVKNMPPKNGVIPLWPNTRVVKCKYYVSQKQNGCNNNTLVQYFSHFYI